jgi:predicted Zn-dependent peptidase
MSGSTYGQLEKGIYKKTVLENGIRVVTETIPYVHSVSIGVWAYVGSRDETENRNGISHFLEHMVFKGTKNRSVKDIAQSLESVGGYLNAFTTKEQTCFYARVLDEHVGKAVDVIADLMLNASFRKEELEKEKLVVLEELKNSEDDPDDIIHDYFEKTLFPTHSLGYPVIGTEANLLRFQREDLQSHVASHYVPARIVIAAAGNVDHADVVHLAGKCFKRLHMENSTMSREPAPNRTVKPSVTEYQRPINQAHICLGTVAYSMKHKDRYPLLVLNALLGEGMSSRLYQTIREKYGFAYSVYSFVNMLSDTGVFGIYVGTDKKNISNSLEIINRELSKLKTKHISHAELDRTKTQIKGTMMLGLESMSSRMMRLGSTELFLETYVSLDSILKKVDAVTVEGVNQVANDIFREKEFSTVIIRPS